MSEVSILFQKGWIFSVAVSGNSKYVISASEDRSIKVINLELNQEAYHIQHAHTGKK